ncbi:hypothetical protein [Mycolicibacter sinensis]|uniref:Uncharacterized protein n=1 Tax=Mycolicibacter sinensis (strain JDM601) TaxID=875328 RepID=A0A1A2E048_MYCSD|nr:hypothetical protein [Mycolicibacter sinensis]OBF98897.1 hypothetical protein A5772_13710 [Mycolicibacter sinensis]OBG00933.1 hypothetical protein A5771_17865 [Mycolicibacter sinensis]
MSLNAWLDGEQPDFERLAVLFADGDVRIVRDDERDAYYLTAAELDSADDEDVYFTIEALLKRINGSARTLTPDFQPVRYARKYTTNGGIVIQPATVQLKIRVSLTVSAVVRGPDGEPQPTSPPPGATHLALAASDGTVDEVLARMAGDLDWFNLFKVYELVRDDSTKPSSIAGMGWATENEQSAFRASANRPDISGEDARHAVSPNTKRPKRTMNLAEGQAWVCNLVSNWLAWKAAPPPGA